MKRTIVLASMTALTALNGIAAAAAAQPIRLAQANAAPPTFAALDANHDGKVSVHEASANDEVFVAFKKLDADHDGDLTQAEFAAFTPAKK